jgi:hypothetical protein
MRHLQGSGISSRCFPASRHGARVSRLVIPPLRVGGHAAETLSSRGVSQIVGLLSEPELRCPGSRRYAWGRSVPGLILSLISFRLEACVPDAPGLALEAAIHLVRGFAEYFAIPSSRHNVSQLTL